MAQLFGSVARHELGHAETLVELHLIARHRHLPELRKRGTFVSPSGVRSIWLRHDLHNFQLRLRALEADVAENGAVLTEAR